MTTYFVMLEIGDVFRQAVHARLSGETRTTPFEYLRPWSRCLARMIKCRPFESTPRLQRWPSRVTRQRRGGVTKKADACVNTWKSYMGYAIGSIPFCHCTTRCATYGHDCRCTDALCIS